jgi:hypothetical protein
MLKLNITSYFASQALDLLINSNKLNNKIQMLASKKILIYSADFEAAAKILDSNYIKFKTEFIN